MRTAIAFKFCDRGCGTDFYYGYSVQQTVGVIECDAQLGKLPLILFDDYDDLTTKASTFERVIVVYLFRSADRKEVFGELPRVAAHSEFLSVGAGAHPSGDPAGTLQYFDYAVVGDCEIAVRDLIETILGHQLAFPVGTWYKSNGEIMKGGTAKPVDLNLIPAFAPKNDLIAPIEITRGCCWGCKFCSVPYIYGGKLRHRSIDQIVKWAKIARDKGRKVINFLTPNAFSYASKGGREIRLDKIEMLLSSLSRIKGVKIVFGNYLSNVRPDFVNQDTIALVKKYTQTPTIHMGGQSGSDRILRSSRTGYTVDDIRRAVQIVRKAGLNCSVDFIYGLPGETRQDRTKTMNFIIELLHLGAKPRIHAFMPLPGTPFEHEPRGKVPAKHKERFVPMARSKQVMTPFEYEEVF